MTQSPHPDPEPPRPPGVPERDLDIPIDTGETQVPDDTDVQPDAGTVEPPD
jgi:hypothetical protein